MYPDTSTHSDMIPLISVVIPCYNCAAFVDRAINSVLHQTFKNWELILVDNNSTDGTVHILDKFALKYPGKIKVVYETRKGAPAARNKGLYEAKAPWIQFLDADDELLPDKLEGQYKIAEKEQPAIVASPYTICGKRSSKPFKLTRMLESDDFWLGLIRSRLGITSANLWNRETVLAVGGWSENLVSSQEYDLMFRVLQQYARVGFDPRNQTIVHIGAGESVSRGGGDNKALQILEARIGLRLRIKDYLQANKMLTKTRLRYLDRFIYKQLYTHYRTFPDDVVTKLRNLNLYLNIADRLRGNYFMLKMDLKRMLISPRI